MVPITEPKEKKNFGDGSKTVLEIPQRMILTALYAKLVYGQWPIGV